METKELLKIINDAFDANIKIYKHGNRPTLYGKRAFLEEIKQKISPPLTKPNS